MYIDLAEEKRNEKHNLYREIDSKLEAELFYHFNGQPYTYRQRNIMNLDGYVNIEIHVSALNHGEVIHVTDRFLTDQFLNRFHHIRFLLKCKVLFIMSAISFIEMREIVEKLNTFTDLVDDTYN